MLNVTETCLKAAASSVGRVGTDFRVHLLLSFYKLKTWKPREAKWGKW
jgi:hypothetical protein